MSSTQPEMTPEGRELDSRLRRLSDQLFEDIDLAAERSHASALELREGIMCWFGGDVFDAYADWLEGDSV